jgi:hypothetical protein
VTGHRCTKRPILGDVKPGDTWTCPECEATWECQLYEYGIHEYPDGKIRRSEKGWQYLGRTEEP